MNRKEKIQEYIKDHPGRSAMAIGETFVFLGLMLLCNFAGALVTLGFAAIIVGVTLFVGNND